jgi:hypothetical protein
MGSYCLSSAGGTYFAKYIFSMPRSGSSSLGLQPLINMAARIAAFIVIRCRMFINVGEPPNVQIRHAGWMTSSAKAELERPSRVACSGVRRHFVNHKLPLLIPAGFGQCLSPSPQLNPGSAHQPPQTSEAVQLWCSRSNALADALVEPVKPESRLRIWKNIGHTCGVVQRFNYIELIQAKLILAGKTVSLDGDLLTLGKQVYEQGLG